MYYNIVLHKLYQIGIRGTAHDWLKCYRNNRFQYAKLENTITIIEAGKITPTTLQLISFYVWFYPTGFILWIHCVSQL